MVRFVVCNVESDMDIKPKVAVEYRQSIKTKPHNQEPEPPAPFLKKMEVHRPPTKTADNILSLDEQVEHSFVGVAPRERFELPRDRPTRFPVARTTRLCDLGSQSNPNDITV